MIHQLWYKNLVQHYSNTILTLACAVSCHIKPLWSNLSHHSCFNWPSEVCYIIALIGSRRGNRSAHLMLLCQINTVSHPPLAKLEREWYLNGMRGQRGTSVVACVFLGISFHPEVYPHFSFQSTFCSPRLPPYTWVHLHSAVGRDFSLCCRGIQHHRRDDSCKPSKR